MNVGRSIKVALAKRGMRQHELAGKMGITASSMSQLANQEHCMTSTLQRLADIFGMPVSEFVQLGEED